MFKVKKPAIIGLLVVLLVFTGYLNHQLTQQAQLKASKDYQNHELSQLAKSEGKDKDNVVDIDNVDVVDSAELTKTDTLEAISMEASMSSKNYFVEYRLSRDKLRASVVDKLDQIISNPNTNGDTRTEAQKEIMKLGNTSEKELQIEGLIKGKGYEDALVFLTDKDIKIVVSSVELGEQDMVKILDIVKSETEYDTNNIKIMKKQ